MIGPPATSRGRFLADGAGVGPGTAGGVSAAAGACCIGIATGAGTGIGGTGGTRPRVGGGVLVSSSTGRRLLVKYVYNFELYQVGQLC